MAYFLDRLVRTALLERTAYEEVEADTGATGQAVAVVLLSSLAAGLGAAGIRGPALGTQAAITGLALVTWSAWAMLVLQIGARWMPEPSTRSDAGELLRTIGFAAAPGLLQVFGVFPAISTPVFVVAWLWMFAAMVVAIRQALDYRSTTHALAVTAVGFLIVLAVAIVLGMLIVQPVF
ncbi:MAG: YIP1 family protein [Vicinamibacterales bacterium]